MSEQAQPGSAQVPAARGLFVRQSSGLIREFRPSDVFVFNTLGYALGLVLAVVPTFAAGLWPEQNVLVIVTIGTLLTIAGIDAGPKLSADLRLRSGAGGVDMHPVGSTACRSVIERHRPMLGLHGHLHESRGTYKLGPTVGINPGSEYNEGVLRARRSRSRRAS